MNLLIVDDQPSIVASLLTGIDWRGLGFNNVFSAISALAAKEVFKKEKVDILLTDIEMPVENGISLLAWVREEGYLSECVFLTSHPDFFYAKQAISLAAADYVLQPAKNEDIIRAVEKARARVLEHQKLEDLKPNKFSCAAQNSGIRDFFEQWPEPTDGKAAFEKKLSGLKDMGITTPKACPVFVLWVEIVRWSKIPRSGAEVIRDYQEQLSRAMGFIRAVAISWYVDDSHFYSVIFGGSESGLKLHLKLFVDALKKDLGILAYMAVGKTDLSVLKHGIEDVFVWGVSRLDGGKRNDFCESCIDFVLLPCKREPVEFMSETVSKSSKNYYAQILLYIREHIDQPLTRQNIANHLFLSPDYVNSIVKNAIGYSCTELIIRVKMSYAKTLLETTQLPVGEVAQRVGYTSFAYFSKVYKDLYGKTPRQSRHETER